MTIMFKKLKESTTFQIVIISLGIMNFQWLSGSIEATLTEYGTATALILGIWLGRETKEAYFKEQ